MTKNLFQSSVTFKLCEFNDNEFVDVETITLRSMTIAGYNFLNSYIRQTYLTTQKDAIKNWDKKDQEEYLQLAMRHIFRLGIGTKEGNDILFDTEEGNLYYTWVYVRDHVRDGKKIFGTIEEWEKAFRSSALAYYENIRRFNISVVDLAMLTAKEVSTELPLEIDTSGMEFLISSLLAAGVSKDDVNNLTVEEAFKVLDIKYPSLDKKEPLLVTDDPEEFKQALAEQLTQMQ